MCHSIKSTLTVAMQNTIFILHHKIVAGYYGIPAGVCPFVRSLFPDNSSKSFRHIGFYSGQTGFESHDRLEIFLAVLLSFVITFML